MKDERASSVCSEEAPPSSPESVASSGGESSPQPPSPYDDQPFSPSFVSSEEEESSSSPSSSPLPPPSSSSSSSSSSPPSSSPHGYPFGFDPSGESFGCQEEFVRAVGAGDPKELERVLSRYPQLVQINGFTSDGQTALTRSCLDGNLEVIEVLLAHGASLHLANRDGFSPLHLACWMGRHDVMQYLLRSAAAAAATRR